MIACVDEAERRGLPSIRLVGVAANPRALTLYNSLQFRARELIMQCRGAIDARHDGAIAEDARREGITIRPMTAADLIACDRLQIAVNSYSRIDALSHAFHAQPAEAAALDKPAQDGAALVVGGAVDPSLPPPPPRTCFVAVNRAGRVVGYVDGPSSKCHWVATTESVIVYLHHALGLELRRNGDSGARLTVHVLTRQHGALLERFDQLGVRGSRQLYLMSRGEYLEPRRFVYCPSVLS